MGIHYNMAFVVWRHVGEKRRPELMLIGYHEASIRLLTVINTFLIVLLLFNLSMLLWNISERWPQIDFSLEYLWTKYSKRHPEHLNYYTIPLTSEVLKLSNSIQSKLVNSRIYTKDLVGSH